MSDILKVSGLVKYYDQFTLDHINISVPEDGVVGFIGSNGAGKTTTIKAILELISYDAGSIELFGDTLTETAQNGLPAQTKQRIGVVFDTLPFPCRLPANRHRGNWQSVLRQLGYVLL